jgi:glycine/D-amino acid oxidase-like deaminating enzyme
MPNALSDVSFWFDAIGELPAITTPPMPQQVDVAIVGAGYTGLWSAYYLKRLDPGLDIAVFEAERAGFGASGRNGGWCMGTAWGVEPLLRRAETRSRGMALARALFETVDEIGRVCQAENIDAHFAKGGALNVATIPFQVDQLRHHVDALHRAGFDETDYRWLSADESQQRLRMTPNHGALYFRHVAAVQPARLAVGLADVVRRQGVRIHEATPVTAIQPGRVMTQRGAVRAGTIIRATEGYTDSIAGQRRRIMPLYSMIVATEPLPAEVWGEIGLAERETFGDSRRQVIYGQRTLDDRLVLGGRGGYYYASELRRAIEPDNPKLARVRGLIPQLFPILKDVRFSHGWGGLMGVPRHWRPCVQFDQATRIGWAGGYVGEGVGASNLAARVLADLVLQRQSALTELPWVDDVARRWEVEPLRWLGGKAIEIAGGLADREEFSSGQPSRLWGALFDQFVLR